MAASHPPHEINPEWLEQARSIALALPEATEKETWGHPTFRVRNKIFSGIGSSGGSVEFVDPSAIGADTASAQPTVTMTMKAAPGEQQSLLAQGLPFFKPKYVGNSGWIGIMISDRTDWAEVEELVLDSYVAIAPKKLSKLLLADLAGPVDDAAGPVE